MSTDLLKSQANERVDLVDFDFLANEGLQDIINEPVSKFLANPNGQRAWILEGFAIDCPAGKQLRVTKGKAILSTRQAGQVKYGYLTTLGDAVKIVDLATYSPGTYNVYVRFEYVDGDSSSRVFWNPAGGGGEFASTVPTRIKANWSIRVENTSPGAEWLKIGEVDQATLATPTTGITDQWPFYFEGEIHNSYQSGWSTDGGGGANDRDTDRDTYGIKDLQTFTAAMRQCVEDIKGRGLRRWWDPDIGGMNIGFNGTVFEDTLAVGDADFRMKMTGSGATAITRIDFDNDDVIYFDRDNNYFEHRIANSREMVVAADGVRVNNGLYVGDALGTPTDNDLIVEQDIYAQNGMFKRDDNNYMFVGNGNYFDWYLNTAHELRLQPEGLNVANGLRVGNVLTVPNGTGDIDGSGDLTMATITMTGFSVDADGDTDVKTLDVTSGPSLSSSGISNAKAISGATTIDASGDLTVGSITMTGAISAGALTGTSLNLGSGNITCGGIDNNSQNITEVGSLSGVTSISMSSSISGATSISASGAISGGSLNVGTGAIDGGTITAATRFVSNGTTTPSELQWATWGHNPGNADPGSYQAARAMNYQLAPWLKCTVTSTGVFNSQTSWNVFSTTNDADGEYTIVAKQGAPHNACTMLATPDNSSSSAYYHCSTYSSYTGFTYEARVFTWSVSSAGLRDHGFCFMAFGP